MKICKNCGKEFTANSNGQKFCDTTCRAKYFTDKKRKTDMSVRKCRQCGKEFKPKTYNQYFCSLGCRNVKNKRYCITCGTELVNRKSKYCSIKCRNEDYKANGHTIVRKGAKQMNTHDATEVAYKNGYKAGVKELAKKLEEKAEYGWVINGCQDYAVSLDDISKIAKELAGDTDDR